MTKKIIPIHCGGGRDLYPDDGYSEKMKCSCGLDIKFQRTGYNDRYFFDTVFKNPVECVCACGKKHFVQWTRDGIEIEVNP